MILGFLDFSVMLVALVLTTGCAVGIWYVFAYDKGEETEECDAADGDVEN